MKNLLYVILGLLVVIWAIVFFGFDTNQTIHLILVVAGLILLVRIFLWVRLVENIKKKRKQRQLLKENLNQ